MAHVFIEKFGVANSIYRTKFGAWCFRESEKKSKRSQKSGLKNIRKLYSSLSPAGGGNFCDFWNRFYRFCNKKQAFRNTKPLTNRPATGSTVNSNPNFFQIPNQKNSPNPPNFFKPRIKTPDFFQTQNKKNVFFFKPRIFKPRIFLTSRKTPDFFRCFGVVTPIFFHPGYNPETPKKVRVFRVLEKFRV